MKCKRPNCSYVAHKNDLCQKHYKVDPERGRIRADVVRDHIAGLRSKGMSLDQIASAAGMTGNGLLYIIRRGVWVRRRSAMAILAVKPEIGRSRVGIDATGSRRRVAAMMRMGWSQRAIARESGLSQTRIHEVMHRDVLGASTVERIRQTFDRIAMTPGPSKRAAQLAAERGFVTALAWDEDAIDDPAAAPDPSWFITDRRAEIAEDVAERRATVHQLTERGLTAEQIAERLGVTTRTVMRHRAARGLERAS